MDLSEIIAIAGHSGLFKIVAQARNGIIVESLVDGKRTHAAANKKISALEDISIYTNDEDMPLSDVMRKIYDKENGGRSLDVQKEGDKLRGYFAEIIADYDEERVYDSDLKKVFNWYNQLHDAKMLKLKEEEGDESAEANAEADKAEDKKEAKAEKKEAKKPAKKPAAKTTKKKDDKKSDDEAEKEAVSSK